MTELEALKHDIARHIQIAADLATELERARGTISIISGALTFAEKERDELRAQVADLRERLSVKTWKD